MIQSFEASGFQLEITGDGSPTLRHKLLGESMHHSHGAAAETWYIYGQVMQQVLQAAASEDRTMQICNVGLGLGYIEMAFASLNHNCQDFQFDSFETVQDLQKNFKSWYQQSVGEWDQVYALACTKLSCAGVAISEPALKAQLQLSQINYHDDILNFTQGRQWNIVCFDAFSKKSGENLWTKTFFDKFLGNFTASDCVFTTYACTSILNEALINNNFTLIKRSGFSGKRECTLAVRGNFMNRVFQTF